MYLEWQEQIILTAKDAHKEWELGYPPEAIKAAMSALKEKLEDYDRVIEDLRAKHGEKAALPVRKEEKDV